MKTSWTKGLSPQQKEDIKSAFMAGGALRERCVFLLREKLIASHRSRSNEISYENPNWAYKQADCCGYERAIEEFISLLT